MEEENKRTKSVNSLDEAGVALVLLLALLLLLLLLLVPPHVVLAVLLTLLGLLHHGKPLLLQLLRRQFPAESAVWSGMLELWRRLHSDLAAALTLTRGRRGGGSALSAGSPPSCHSCATTARARGRPSSEEIWIGFDCGAPSELTSVEVCRQGAERKHRGGEHESLKQFAFPNCSQWERQAAGGADTTKYFFP